MVVGRCLLAAEAVRARFNESVVAVAVAPSISTDMGWWCFLLSQGIALGSDLDRRGLYRRAGGPG